MRLALRTASGAGLLALFLAVLWLGAPWLDGFVALAVALGLLEYRQLWKETGISVDPVVLFGLSAAWLLRYAYPQVPDGQVLLLAGILAGLLLSLRFVASAKPFLGWALALGGAAWLGYCPGFLLLLYHGTQNRPRAVALVLLTVGVAVVGDTLAYLVGSRFGRHRMAPSISPGKTWEGALAALLGSTLLVGLLLPLAVPQVDRLVAFGIGVAAALAAVAGDLVESQLKREVGTKDSGRVLPGHGGVLDRVDSLIFVGAVVYSLLGVVHAN